jgi:transcriptional regulator with XRE-family HTH domain
MIGAQIQLWRERRGLTALALAELAGVHRNTVYRLECGLGCRASMLVKVMSVLKLQISDFRGDAPSLVHLSFENQKDL